MKALTVLTLCLMAMVLLAGCKGGGGSSFSSFFGGSSADDPIILSDLPGGGDTPGGGDDGGGDDDGGGLSHQPEPATIALLGSGLLAYALLRRKKRKK